MDSKFRKSRKWPFWGRWSCYGLPTRRPLLRHWRAVEAATFRMFHAAVTSAALWGLDAVHHTKTASNIMDINMMSMLCLMLHVRRRQDEDLVTYSQRKWRAALSKVTRVQMWSVTQCKRCLTFAGHLECMQPTCGAFRMVRHRNVTERRMQHMVIGGRGGVAQPLRHRRVGVKPCAWENPVESAVQRFREEAETPGQWQPTD